MFTHLFSGGMEEDSPLITYDMIDSADVRMYIFQQVRLHLDSTHAKYISGFIIVFITPTRLRLCTSGGSYAYYVIWLLPSL